MTKYQNRPNYTVYIWVGLGVAAAIFFVIMISNSPPENKKGPSGSTTSLDNLVGQPMPDFTLKDKAGKTYSPQTLKGKNVVLFFNEGLQCYPACWNQIAALGKDNRFKTENTIALSIIPNSAQEWQQALAKMPELNQAIVLFDTDKSVSDKFGTLSVESSMHSGALPGHTYVLIDKGGIVRNFLDDPKMGIHNDELINDLKKLK